MKKPLGIKILIAINLLIGIAALIATTIMIINSYGSDNFSFISIIPFAIIALIYLVATYGLWTLKKWGPDFTQWFYILGAFISLIIFIKPLLSGDPIELGEMIENILSLMITIAVARYLSRKNIKEMYQK